MSHKVAKLKRRQEHPLNASQFWDTDIAPPWFDSLSYQKRIDERVGLNREGKPIVRVVWGPKVMGLYDGVPRYWLRRTKDGEGFLYATVKRWYLEIRVEREQYVPSWNEARYGTTVPAECPEKCEDCGSTAQPIEVFETRLCSQCGSKQLVKGIVVDRGAPPEEFWKFGKMCAVHEGGTDWGACCERADSDGHKRCFGTFRNPNDYDLECISAGVRRRDADRFIDPYAPLTVADLTAIEMSSGLQTERMIAEIEARRTEVLRDQRILSEVGGTFHDVGTSFEKQTPGGIILPT